MYLLFLVYFWNVYYLVILQSNTKTAFELPLQFHLNQVSNAMGLHVCILKTHFPCPLLNFPAFANFELLHKNTHIQLLQHQTVFFHFWVEMIAQVQDAPSCKSKLCCY